MTVWVRATTSKNQEENDDKEDRGIMQGPASGAKNDISYKKGGRQCTLDVVLARKIKSIRTKEQDIELIQWGCSERERG